MSYPIVSSDTQILSRSHVVALLDEKKVPWRNWKHTPGSRTLDDLCKYHREDQFYFRNGDSPQLTIDVHVIVVRVHYYHRHAWLELYEESQVFRDGHVERRGNTFDGLGETRRRGESLEEGAIRCVKEELQFNDPSKYGMSDCLHTQHMDPRPSEKWKGITAVYHRYIHECTIHRDIFNPDGYVEQEEDGRIIYFKWRPMQQRSFLL